MKVRMCKKFVGLNGDELTVIRNRGLRKEHIALARHSPCDWMDCKTHIDSFGSQHLCNFGYGILCFGDCHTVADDLSRDLSRSKRNAERVWSYNNNILCTSQSIHRFIDRCRHHFALDLLTRLYGRDPAEEYVCQRPIHCNTLHTVRHDKVEERFGHAIIYDRMEPLTPMSEPTVVSRGLSSINPSATSAKPE